MLIDRGIVSDVHCFQCSECSGEVLSKTKPSRCTKSGCRASAHGLQRGRPRLPPSTKTPNSTETAIVVHKVKEEKAAPSPEAWPETDPSSTSAQNIYAKPDHAINCQCFMCLNRGKRTVEPDLSPDEQERARRKQKKEARHRELKQDAQRAVEAEGIPPAFMERVNTPSIGHHPNCSCMRCRIKA